MNKVLHIKPEFEKARLFDEVKISYNCFRGTGGMLRAGI
jgi:hypothetical protein